MLLIRGRFRLRLRRGGRLLPGPLFMLLLAAVTGCQKSDRGPAPQASVAAERTASALELKGASALDEEILRKELQQAILASDIDRFLRESARQVLEEVKRAPLDADGIALFRLLAEPKGDPVAQALALYAISFRTGVDSGKRGLLYVGLFELLKEKGPGVIPSVRAARRKLGAWNESRGTVEKSTDAFDFLLNHLRNVLEPS